MVGMARAQQRKRQLINFMKSLLKSFFDLKIIVKHSIPGRIRLQIPALKNNTMLDSSKIEMLQDVISADNAIKSCLLNSCTASILIEYDHKLIDEEYILKYLKNIIDHIRNNYVDISSISSADISQIKSSILINATDSD